MDFIKSLSLDKKGLIIEYNNILKNYYNLENKSLISSTLNRFEQFLDTLKDDLTFVAEYPYVDKMYRDTFYHYYASKKKLYSRDSIKISIFSNEVILDDFYNDVTKVNELYLGFFTLRPTFPAILGRNVISPLAFGESINICSVDTSITSNGVKLVSKGFPHSSQDSEMITCAETTVWAIMEYFGNKYSDYKPLLPSIINKTLGKFSFERLIPSKGLTAGQISYALKDFGFGVKIYSAQAYGSEFMKLLKIYIESGIPVVGAIQNGQIGHAINIVGRVNFEEKDLNLLPVTTIGNNVRLSEFADLDIEYVFVDDNHAPYRKSKLTTPSSHYTDPLWDNCRITNFIVPLYPKIYLEAGEARKLSMSLIQNYDAIKDKEITIKTFLASSRSFKNYINVFSNLSLDLKKVFNALVMPKFVWITEIYEKGNLIANKCDGIIILDATEPKKLNVICSILEDKLIFNTFANVYDIGKQSFTSYNQNLYNYE